MQFFSMDKENNRILISPGAKPVDFIAVEYGFIKFNGDHYTIHSMNSEGLSKQDDYSSLIFGSKLVNDPCMHCGRIDNRILLEEDCSPCTFIYNDYDSVNNGFTLNMRKLQTALLEKGYFRTSLSQFNYSIWKSNN